MNKELKEYLKSTYKITLNNWDRNIKEDEVRKKLKKESKFLAYDREKKKYYSCGF